MVRYVRRGDVVADAARSGRALVFLRHGPAVDASAAAFDAPAAATCGSGLTAAVVALALHRCGAAAVPIYDGAWCEYEASGLPVVVDAE